MQLPFNAQGATSTSALTATSATSNIALPFGDQLQVTNAGTATAFLSFGKDNSVTAVIPAGATPGGEPLMPNATRTFSRGLSAYMAGIVSSGTSLVYVTGGHGAGQP